MTIKLVLLLLLSIIIIIIQTAGTQCVHFRLFRAAFSSTLNLCMRVALGLRLGLYIFVPHVCRCGAFVDVRGLH